MDDSERLRMSKKRDHKIMITEEAIRKVPFIRYREIPEDEYEIIYELAKQVLRHGKRKLLCIPKFQIFCYIEFSQRQSLHIRV